MATLTTRDRAPSYPQVFAEGTPSTVGSAHRLRSRAQPHAKTGHFFQAYRSAIAAPRLRDAPSPKRLVLCRYRRFSGTPGHPKRQRLREIRHPYVARSRSHGFGRCALRFSTAIAKYAAWKHCLEAWLKQGKDLRQKLPVLSGYMGHAILKSSEQYLRLVPGRFVKSLSSLQAPPNHLRHLRRHNNDASNRPESLPSAEITSYKPTSRY